MVSKLGANVAITFWLVKPVNISAVITDRGQVMYPENNMPQCCIMLA
jgi:hypothetical protein